MTNPLQPNDLPKQFTFHQEKESKIILEHVTLEKAVEISKQLGGIKVVPTLGLTDVFTIQFQDPSATDAAMQTLTLKTYDQKAIPGLIIPRMERMGDTGIKMYNVSRELTEILENNPGVETVTKYLSIAKPCIEIQCSSSLTRDELLKNLEDAVSRKQLAILPPTNLPDTTTSIEPQGKLSIQLSNTSLRAMDDCVAALEKFYPITKTTETLDPIWDTPNCVLSFTTVQNRDSVLFILQNTQEKKRRDRLIGAGEGSTSSISTPFSSQPPSLFPDTKQSPLLPPSVTDYRMTDEPIIVVQGARQQDLEQYRAFSDNKKATRCTMTTLPGTNEMGCILNFANLNDRDAALHSMPLDPIVSKLPTTGYLKINDPIIRIDGVEPKDLNRCLRFLTTLGAKNYSSGIDPESNVPFCEIRFTTEKERTHAFQALQNEIQAEKNPRSSSRLASENSMTNELLSSSTSSQRTASNSAPIPSLAASAGQFHSIRPTTPQPLTNSVCCAQLFFQKYTAEGTKFLSDPKNESLIKGAKNYLQTLTLPNAPVAQKIRLFSKNIPDHLSISEATEIWELFTKEDLYAKNRWQTEDLESAMALAEATYLSSQIDPLEQEAITNDQLQKTEAFFAEANKNSSSKETLQKWLKSAEQKPLITTVKRVLNTLSTGRLNSTSRLKELAAKTPYISILELQEMQMLFDLTDAGRTTTNAEIFTSEIRKVAKSYSEKTLTAWKKAFNPLFREAAQKHYDSFITAQFSNVVRLQELLKQAPNISLKEFQELDALCASCKAKAAEAAEAAEAHAFFTQAMQGENPEVTWQSFVNAPENKTTTERVNTYLNTLSFSDPKDTAELKRLSSGIPNMTWEAFLKMFLLFLKYLKEQTEGNSANS